MQRAFAFFPAGYPGLALLLIRAATGAAMAAEAIHYVVALPDASWASQVVAVLLTLDGSMIAVGIMTPVTAAVALVAVSLYLTGWQQLETLLILNSRAAAVEAALLCTAILALGPGAYSVDGKLFGRRQLIIPSRGAPKDP